MAKREVVLSDLKINYLTQAEFDQALALGLIKSDELYLTPYQAPTYTAGYGIDIINGVISVDLPSAEQQSF